MKIAIDCDPNAMQLKNDICKFLKETNVPHEDLDYLSSHPDQDYPDVAFNLAHAIRDGHFDRGILICGTGQGVAICANKVPGIYAGVCSDVYSAERLRKSNNAQIMALGAFVVGSRLALKIVEAWVNSEFEGGGSLKKVERLRELEELTKK